MSTSGSGVIIDGAFGKFVAAVVITLLAAGVIGIWNMNATMNRLVATVDFIRAAQIEMDEDVERNTERLYRYKDE